jgi:NitT/TauT family transport system permease protein
MSARMSPALIKKEVPDVADTMLIGGAGSTPVQVAADAEPPAAPPAGRRRGRALPERAVNLFGTALLVVGLLTTVEVLVANGVLPAAVIARPSAVASALGDLFATGRVWTHIWSTVSGAALGFAISACAGIVLGAVFASLPRLAAIVYPIIVAFRALPTVAVAPLLVLWLGFGLESKVAVVAIITFFPILINSMEGMKVRHPDQVEILTALGASKLQVFQHLRAPGSVPFIVSGLHVGSYLALIGAVVAEFVGGNAGLGYSLEQQRTQFNVPGIYAFLALLMAAGLLTHIAMMICEHRAKRWSDA